MKRYLDFMAKYYPEGDKNSLFNTYGYSTAQLLIHTLKQCGDDLTRENVMKQATSLKNVETDLALPGIRANTSPTDYRVNKQLQMERFNGERWELFGPIIEDTGGCGLTPRHSSSQRRVGKGAIAPCAPSNRKRRDRWCARCALHTLRTLLVMPGLSRA